MGLSLPIAIFLCDHELNCSIFNLCPTRRVWHLINSRFVSNITYSASAEVRFSATGMVIEGGFRAVKLSEHEYINIIWSQIVESMTFVI